MSFNPSDVPIIQKRVFSWTEAYYSAIANIIKRYPNPELLFPSYFLPRPRQIRLVVTPTACVVFTYASKDPSTAEWMDATVKEVTDGLLEFNMKTTQIRTEIFFGYDKAAYTTNNKTWEKLTVFNASAARLWTVDTARAEAYNHILSSTIIKLLGLPSSQIDRRTSQEDPKKVASRELRHLIRDFESLLADATKEEEVQRFIKEHPYLLDLRAISVDPKVPLGSEYVTDFVVTLPGSRYLLVELEQAKHVLYTKRYNQTAALTHAIRQVEDWLEWSYDNLSYLRERYPGIHEPDGLVILGRRSSLDRKAAKALKRHNVGSRIRVATYDDLIDDVRAIALNLERGTIPPSSSVVG